MATLLEKLDAIIEQSINGNIYNNVHTYTKSLALTNGTPASQTNAAIALQQPAPNLYSPSNPYSPNLSYVPQYNPPVQDNIYNPQNLYNPDNTFAPMATNSPVGGVGGFDVFAIAHWVRAIGTEFGAFARPGETNGQRLQHIAKGASFLATQFLLASFNPGDPNVGGRLNQVYNPLSFALSAVPLIRTATTIGSPNAAAALSVDGNVYSNAALAAPDRTLLIRQGIYKKAVSATDIAQLQLPSLQYLGDIASQGRPLPVTLPVSIEGQVDQTGPTAALAKVLPIHKNIYTPDNRYSDGPVIDQTALQDLYSQYAKVGVSTTIPQLQLSKLFANAAPLQTSEIQYSWIAAGRFKPGAFSVSPASFPNDVSMQFNGEENGLVTEELAPSDANNYMPFFFQDMRDATRSLLYFRAFLHEGLEENFSPNWNSENFYGRVDEVPTYQNTVRTISVAFDVVAFAPEDLTPMYQKMHRLQSLVYPSFDTGGFIQAGPLVRMRIGDLICANVGERRRKKGLPGYINTLSFAYDDGIWNIDEDFKVPRKVTVTLGFTVIHEGNPGIYPFQSINVNTNTNVTAVAPIFGALGTPDDTTGVATVDSANIRGVSGKVFQTLATALAPTDEVPPQQVSMQDTTNRIP